jgi:hypothetical protein
MPAAFFLGESKGWCLDCASMVARSSILQRRVLAIQRRVLFLRAHARSCVDWRLASAWNADAGSVRPQSLPNRASCCGLGCCRLAVCGPDARAFDFYGGALFLGSEPNTSACKTSASLGAILAHAESHAGHRNVRALLVLGMYMCSGPWISIGTRSCDCVAR